MVLSVGERSRKCKNIIRYIQAMFIQTTYLSEPDISPTKLARHLKVSPRTVSRLLIGHSNVSAEMALKLSVVLGGSPESWLQIQRNYDLWQARQTLDTEGYQQLCT